MNAYKDWRQAMSVRRNYLLLAMLVILLSGLTVAQVSADNFPDEDGPLRVRTTLTGDYATLAAGAGLEETGINSVTLDVPGTAVVAAYLYWAGTGIDDLGDDTVTFQVDANPAQSLTAQDTYGPTFWYFGDDGTYVHHVYVLEVTSLVQLGSHTYTLSDYDVSGISSLAYGFGLVVVYEDPSLNESTVTLMDGLDSVFFGFEPPRDSPSSVNCITFEANPDLPRVLDFYVFAGGSADSDEEDRPNNLHYVVGSGAPPTAVVGAPGSVVVNDPFTSADGNAWDTYVETIVVPAGATYVCVQTESVEGVPFGASFLWLMGGFTLKEETPTAVSLSSFTAANNLILPVSAVLLALTAVSAITGVVLTRRRRQQA